jgi:hypothetical protein
MLAGVEHLECSLDLRLAAGQHDSQFLVRRN